VRMTRLLPGATIPTELHEDVEVCYLVEGSIQYAGRTWEGGKTQDKGTYLYIPHGSRVETLSSESGGTFFIISLPMMAELEAERRRSDSLQTA
jgi:hypothetical protein